MSETLKLSIVTPSYNHGRFLEQAILSVINQDYVNVEYIIIDGASTDNSIEIIRKYNKHIAYWVSEPDEDLRYALQKGFAQANGDVIAWQNADDFYEPNVLGRVMRVFKNFPNVDLVFGNINIINEFNQVIDKLCHIPLFYPLDLFAGLPFQNHAAFFRRSLWEKAGGITFQELNYDADLIYRISRIAHPFFIHSELGAYRNHAGSITFSERSTNIQKDRWVIRRRFLGRWGRLPTWCFFPIVGLAKFRRFAYLVYQREWNYLLSHTKIAIRKIFIITS